MLYLTQRVDSPGKLTASVTLPIDVRVKSRIKVTLNDGREAGLLLPRGLLLRGGDVLSNEDGSEFVQVIAADEGVSVVRCDDPFTWRKPAITSATATFRCKSCPASCAITTIMCWTICCASSAWRSFASCRLNRKPAPTPAKATATATVIVTIMTTSSSQHSH
jgi:hypothetical protein